MTTARLAPGVALVTVPDQGLAVRTPEGEFLRVDTGAAAPEELVNRLTNGGDGGDGGDGGNAGDGGDGGQAAGELAYLVAAFEEAGYATRDPSVPAARPFGSLAGRTVLALGDPVLTGPLARCVRDLGGEFRDVEPGDLSDLATESQHLTAVVWCLDGPVPLGLWDEADRLSEGGTAWLRCHREGGHVWVEPPACGPGDVTSADVRLRRLAATPAHRELAAYWKGLRAGDEGPGHHAASAALTAGLLTADLLAWATGPDCPRFRAARRTLRRIDVRDLTITPHPILPVPEVTGGPGIVGAQGAVGAPGAVEAGRDRASRPGRAQGAA
ncbi:hypothetical protein ACGFYP_14085 [Streptomyces sp. NPDC048370]|uniref:hypothetical protein n=1 Tax=Streptomyces sp. NPDC048370 TaxID=3365540 RepID=UPI00371570DE